MNGPNALRAICVGMLLCSAGAASAQDGRVYGLLHAEASGIASQLLEAGVQEQAAASGARIVVHDSASNPTGQSDALAAMVAQGVDGIVLVAIDANGIIPAVREAEAAGIAVVAVDVALAEPGLAVEIRTNDEIASATLGQFVAGVVTAGGEPVTLGLVGAPSSPIQTARMDGFLRSIEGVPLIMSGGLANGENLLDISTAATTDLLNANPEINALYASGDAALLGAMAAAQATNRQDDIAIYGWGLSLPVVEALEAGRVAAVVQPDSAGLGRAAVEALDSVAAGETPEPVVDVPPTIVTLQNVHEFRPLFR